MKYLLHLILYLVILFVTFSVLSVLLLRFIPVSFTPLKVFSLFEEGEGKNMAVTSKWVSLDNISPEMVTAVIATEDGNFLKHKGFDIDAIRQAVEESKEGKRLRGASTISQQTAKNVFCLPQRNWLRKGIETWFTGWIELFWSKRRIMEVYLNVIETHPHTYGVEATARLFYKKPALDLNRYEAAMIATVLPSPRRMNIGAPSSYMTRRAARVRQMMAQVGRVDFDHPPANEEKQEKK